MKQPSPVQNRMGSNNLMRFNYLANAHLHRSGIARDESNRLSGSGKRILLLLSILLLSACSSLPGSGDTVPPVAKAISVMSGDSDVLPDKEAKSGVATSGAETVQGIDESRQSENAVYPGNGIFVKAQSRPDPNKQLEAGDVTLNFENTDLREVVNIILGDLLKVNYIIDPGVRGGVSMQTGRPLSRTLLVPTLETLLRMNGATLVIDGQGMHHVVPQAKASRGLMTPQLTDATMALPRGYSIQVAPLKYIAVGEMAKILEPIASKENIIRVDPRRNLLLLAGDSQELTYLLETIDTFDVDWLAGLSVGFFALKYTETTDVVDDLNSLLEGETGGLLDGLIKIVPVTSANGLLVISPRAHYLKEVEKWIGRLDQLSAQNGTEERLYVYRVQNGDAEKLAELLNDLLKSDSKKDTKKASIAPGLKAKEVNTAKDSATSTATRTVSASSGSGLQGVSQLASDVRIVADTEKNSLLVMATAKDYSKLESVLMSLDIVPLQVHVEATIVEVTLGGDLQYGLQWFFKTHHGSKKGIVSLDGALDSASSSGLGAFFPGFNWSIVDNADNVRAVLSAFAGDTAVNVLSAPSVMVLDNHEATIQVGDQVPVATQQQQSTDANSTVINSIQYRDTGVLLKVKPRVNPGGLVTMEINQEVSSVSKTDTSNLDSPTIQTRKIASTVAINSGESVVLGGLMRDEGSNGRSGVPVLYKLPLIGSLFGETSNTSRRTELVVVLTPRVIENSADARRITQDFRDRMQGLRDAF